MDSEERYDRMRRTEWIDMGRIHASRILVAGAGALGNEVVKNLVLAGFRDITVADPDTVEISNLSRCVLFRPSDEGRNKAETVSERAAELDPGASVTAFPQRIQELEKWDYGLVIGCLDSISARLHVNAHCMYFGIPYVDGGTDGFAGRIQTVLPDGPCLECGINRTHIDELHRTFSCVSPTERREGPPPLSSGITTTAVVAGYQVREALKIVCGCGRYCVRNCAYYDGITGETSVLELEMNGKCPNHRGKRV